jgi:hypothetical protein
MLQNPLGVSLLIHWELFNGAKSMVRGTMIWEISTWQTNQTNKQPSFINRFGFFFFSQEEKEDHK